jgi:hypothetical protein
MMVMMMMMMMLQREQRLSYSSSNSNSKSSSTWSVKKVYVGAFSCSFLLWNKDFSFTVG